MRAESAALTRTASRLPENLHRKRQLTERPMNHRCLFFSLQHPMSRPTDIMQSSSCNPLINLMPLRACEWGMELACSYSHSFQGPPESTTQKGTFMNRAIVLKVAAVAVVAGLAGCQDLKPLQADVDSLKQQVAKLSSDTAAAKSSADQANSTASAANQAASSAQSTANQALAAAQASQSAVDATNEKIDRMFKRSISK